MSKTTKTKTMCQCHALDEQGGNGECTRSLGRWPLRVTVVPAWQRGSAAASGTLISDLNRRMDSVRVNARCWADWAREHVACDDQDFVDVRR